jgi:uncharacterized membrane protein
LLTAVSFLYLWWLWAWDQPRGVNAADDALLLGVLLVFLVSASLWMWCTLRVLSGHLSRKWLTLNLWTTAAASLGLAALTLSQPGDTPTKQYLAQASAAMLVIQHLFWDFIVWNSGFKA